MIEDRQRVNIQVSVRLDQIDAEVKLLLDKAQNILSGIASSNFNTIEDPLSNHCFQKIDNVRMDLADADAVLQDVMSIVNSYNLLIAQSRQPQQSEQPSVETGTHEPIDYNVLKPNNSISELEEKLAMFKSTLEDLNTESADVNNSQ